MKKLILITVCILFFTACSKETQDIGLENIQTPDFQVTETPEASNPEPAFDLNGRKVLFSSWVDYIKGERGVSEAGDLKADAIEALEKKYNFVLEYVSYVPYDDYVAQLSQYILSGTPPADIVQLSLTHYFPTMLSKKYLAAWDDLPGIDINAPKWNKAIKEFAEYKGKIYGGISGILAARGEIFFNKNIFQRVSLENPYELVKNNQWTWDKFLEYAIKSNLDENADGVTDIYALGTYGGVAEQCFIASNEGRTVDFLSDGSAQFVMNDSNTLEALKFVQDLHVTYKVFMPSGSQWDESMHKFKDGQLSMNIGEFWFTQSYYAKYNMVDEFGIVPVPLGPSAGGKYISAVNDTELYSILDITQDKEIISYILDGYTDPVEGIDDWQQWEQDIEPFICDEESKEMLKIVIDGAKIFNLNLFAALNDLRWQTYWQIYSGQKSPASAIEEMAPAAQLLIDDVMNEFKQ